MELTPSHCAVQLFTGADPAVSGPAGGRGEAPGPEVLLHGPGVDPQGAPSVRAPQGMGAPLPGGERPCAHHTRSCVVVQLDGNYIRAHAVMEHLGKSWDLKNIYFQA